MIVETSANQLFSVQESSDPALSHCWVGKQYVRVKSHGDIRYRFTAAEQRSTKSRLVRKEGSKIIDRDANAV
jgi:hypothetical protein